jgi:hypothetical protein
MRNQHKRMALGRKSEEKVGDRGGVARVEIVGGFVGQDDGGAEEQGAGKGGAAALSVAEHVGQMGGAFREAEAVKKSAGAVAAIVRAAHVAAFAGGATGQERGEQHVVEHGERADQLGGLENKTEKGVANEGAFGVGKGQGIPSVDEDVAGVGAEEQGEDAEESRFSAAGGAGDGGGFAGLYPE